MARATKDPKDNEDYLFQMCQEKNWDAVREYLAGSANIAPSAALGANASISVDPTTRTTITTAPAAAAAAATATTTSTTTRRRRRSSSSSVLAKEEQTLLVTAPASISSPADSPSRKSIPAAQMANEIKKRAIMCCSSSSSSSDEDSPTSTRKIGRRQQSCLHEACDRGAPADVVRMMIDIAGNDLTKLKDNHGRTALLIACGRSGACYDVIKTLAESGGKELVLMKSDYDGGTALHWLCMCMDSHFAAEEKITLLIRVGGEELLSMEEHLGQTAYHVAKSKPGMTQTILQLLKDPNKVMDRTGASTGIPVDMKDKLAKAKKAVERLTRKNKELKEKILALEAAADPRTLAEMEQKFDALLQNKISNLGAKVEVLMENWISNLESRLGILHIDDPDNLVPKCSRFEAL